MKVLSAHVVPHFAPRLEYGAAASFFVSLPEAIAARLRGSSRASPETAGDRLVQIPGIRPVTATAVIAAIGNGAAFQKGREFAAWMGVVPRECSTGGKQTLLGVSKRGNAYSRRLFVQGTSAVLQQKAS